MGSRDFYVPSSPANAPLEGQANYLREMLYNNEHLWEILRRGQEIDLPQWYLGAGCIAQTFWNYQHGFGAAEHIKDVDIAYFDRGDLSESAERRNEERISAQFASLPLRFGVRNQARVHLWYEQRFGYPIKPYVSIEDAINSWPTTASSIGVRFDRRDTRIYAPRELQGLEEKRDVYFLREERDERGAHRPNDVKFGYAAMYDHRQPGSQAKFAAGQTYKIADAGGNGDMIGFRIDDFGTFFINGIKNNSDHITYLQFKKITGFRFEIHYPAPNL